MCFQKRHAVVLIAGLTLSSCTFVQARQIQNRANDAVQARQEQVYIERAVIEANKVALNQLMFAKYQEALATCDERAAASLEETENICKIIYDEAITFLDAAKPQLLSEDVIDKYIELKNKLREARQPRDVDE